MLKYVMGEMLLSVADRIHPKRNKFATGVENRATHGSKFNDNHDILIHGQDTSYKMHPQKVIPRK